MPEVGKADQVEASSDTFCFLLKSHYFYKHLIVENNFLMPCMYILECADDSLYTGSTKNLALRFIEHMNGLGCNHTRERLPVKLVYCEYYDRIDYAYEREKQVQGWSRAKKLALIQGKDKELPKLARNMKRSQWFTNPSRKIIRD